MPEKHFAHVSEVIGWLEEEMERARLRPEDVKQARREARAQRREQRQQARGRSDPETMG
jgi:hypothetical protein